MASPWWSADMREENYVTYVNIVPHSNLKSYQVRIGNDARWYNNPYCGNQTFTGGVSNVNQTISCGLSGRYLFVVMPDVTSSLIMYEIEAYEI